MSKQPIRFSRAASRSEVSLLSLFVKAFFSASPDSLMLHQTDFLLDFYKYVALNVLGYTSSSFVRERKNVFVGMVNSLTDCAVTESPSVLGVSLATRLL